jgi:hypothetical protein
VPPKQTVPRDIQAASASRRSSASSCGSIENAESTPPSARDSVKCFSITVAPSATDATATPTPIVWSERPTSRPKMARIAGMVRTFVFSGVAG